MKPAWFFFRRQLARKDSFEHLLIQVLRYRPKDIGLFILATTHRSARCQLNGYQAANNERLEYLGDALMNAVVADMLYRHYPSKMEGFLTKMRAKIVSRETLNRIAKEMGMEHIIHTNIDDNISNNVLGDALEAICGAIFLEAGFKKTKSYILNRVIKPFIDLDDYENMTFDFKSQLIEWSQKNAVELIFEDFEQFDSTHNQPLFISKVKVHDEILGSGKGNSKKEAQQEAARKALDHYIDY